MRLLPRRTDIYRELMDKVASAVLQMQMKCLGGIFSRFPPSTIEGWLPGWLQSSSFCCGCCCWWRVPLLISAPPTDCLLMHFSNRGWCGSAVLRGSTSTRVGEIESCALFLRIFFWRSRRWGSGLAHNISTGVALVLRAIVPRFM